MTIDFLILVTAITGIAVCVFAIGWIGMVERRLTAMESAKKPSPRTPKST